MKKRVVITGMGILTVLGRGVSTTLEMLKTAKSPFGEIRSFSGERYERNIGAEVQEDSIDQECKKDVYMKHDRALHLIYTACKDALNNAGLYENNNKASDASIFLGTTLGGMLLGQKFHKDYLMGKNKRLRISLLKSYRSRDQIAYIAQKFGFLGDTFILNNACTSGLSAVGLAFRRLCSGESPFAIAGGYDVMSEFTYAGFNSLQLMTSEKYRPFDKNRSGLVLGEGAGVIILEELGHALQRGANIIAEIIGFGQSSDAYHITKPDPQALGACRAITMAMEYAGISAGDIDYINAHGTGTLANDYAEAKAINMAFGDSGTKIPISSTKQMTGHALGASGAIEVIISAIAVRNNFIPVNLNYETPDPDINLNVISKDYQDTELKIVLSNSFGFGGSNGTILLKKFDR